MRGPAILRVNLINRRTGATYTSLPNATSLSYKTDMRQFTDSFELEVEFRIEQKVSIMSHDFIEFFYDFDGQPFQVGVGFLEDFVEETTPAKISIKANGRDLLGHLITLPFSEQLHYNSGIDIETFAQTALQNSYVQEYLKLKNISGMILDQGSFKGPLLIKTTADKNRGAVIQEYASDVAMNLVYLTRRGRVAIYGRDFKDKMSTGKTLSHFGDKNVQNFVRRRNFSKVISECRVMYSGGEGNLDLNKMPSPIFKNTDPDVKHIYAPLFKVLSTSDLVSLSGQFNVQDRIAAVAKSEIRRSNQNISPVVIRATHPYHIDEAGDRVAYEVGQNWRIKSDHYNINREMKLAGINYSQDSTSSDIQLMFVDLDTLV